MKIMRRERMHLSRNFYVLVSDPKKILSDFIRHIFPLSFIYPTVIDKDVGKTNTPF